VTTAIALVEQPFSGLSALRVQAQLTTVLSGEALLKAAARRLLAAAAAPVARAAKELRFEGCGALKARPFARIGIEARNRKQTLDQATNRALPVIESTPETPEIVVLSYRTDYMGGVPPRGRPA